MRIRYLQSHRQSALNLYRQRAILLRQWRVPAASLARLEERLRAHLYVLAEAGEVDADPQRPPEAFAAVACRQLRGEGDALGRACELATERPPLAGAVFEALALLPPSLEDWSEAYATYPALRPRLFDCARRGRIEASQGFLNQSELQHFDPALQLAALRYAAERVDVGRDIFLPYLAERAPEPIRVAALWGGLLRQDGKARSALRPIFNAAQEPESRTDLLRLIALSGDPEHLPILRQYAEREPAAGMGMLALYGHAAVVPDLLAGLEKAVSAEAAGQAWAFMFGAELPRRPRLGMVAEEETAAYAAAGSLPNALAARRSWQQQSHGRSDERRLIAGEAADLRGLVMAACDWAGVAGADVLALLALATRGRHCLDPFGWQALRRQALDAMGVSTAPVLPDDLDSLDPWEHGHYA